MSIRINHPKNTVTSTSDFTFMTQGGTPTSPASFRINASSVIMPVQPLPSGEKGSMVFDSVSGSMKYHNGTSWIELVSKDSITGPIQVDLEKIYNKLNTKVDNVTYSSSKIPSASISGSTLSIVFPLDSGGGSGGGEIPGLFTSCLPGSIMDYSLTSGQSASSIREQLSGVAGGQNGRDGSQAKPFITKSGWTLADGLYWEWNGVNGKLVKQVPNLNRNAYRKSISLDGITKIDNVISGSVSINGTELSLDNLPAHSFSLSGTTNITGNHNHGVPVESRYWNSYKSAIVPASNWPGACHTFHNYRTNSTTDGDHYHTFSGQTETIGKNVPHSHSASNVDVDHFNIAVLYNIAEQSLALNQDYADGRYVLKTGDTMSGPLTIANNATIKSDDNNLTLWFKGSNNAERAAIYHSSTSNTLRLRSFGGSEMYLDQQGKLFSHIISGDQLEVSGSASTGALNVTGQITATGDIWAFSDIRLKENMIPIDNALDKISKIYGYIGNMKGENKKRSMVIAQEILKILPEAIDYSDDEYMKVSYSSLIPLLINAINELNKKIDNGGNA